jgi:N-acetylglucosamine-6-sulfatase
MRLRLPVSVVAAVVFVMVVAAGSTLAAPRPDASASEAARSRLGADDRPNVVLIVTDDQTAYDLRWMPHTRRLLGDHGVTYRNFLSPHPLCCPARAELLTGQYAHNNGVHHNSGPWGGWEAFNPTNNIGLWMQAAGYSTALVGKYLNGYHGQEPRVPGWDMFDPTIRGTYSPYGITMGNNYDPVRFDDVYTADLVNRRTLSTIRRFAKLDKPFFVYSSQLAPHGMHVNGHWVPPVPAPRHRGMFRHVRPPSFSDPAYDERDLSDKYQDYRDGSNVSRERMARVFRGRVESLQAVDEAVRDTVRALKRLGELRNTVIMFTSDNGMMLGEHAFYGKNTPWEEALRIPMVVRGPGIPTGVVRRQTMTLVDIAPTILDLGDAVAPVPQDGRSLLPTLNSAAAPGYATNLIQGGDDDAPWLFRGVRTRRYTYVMFANGFVEMYDRKRDPHQLRSVAGMPTYADVERELQRRSLLLQNCVGPACYEAFGPLPKLLD